MIIPEIGGGRELMAEKTIRGMRDLALKIAEIKPKVIICITPHGNVFQDGVSVIYETKLEGDMAAYGAPLPLICTHLDANYYTALIKIYKLFISAVLL